MVCSCVMQISNLSKVLLKAIAIGAQCLCLLVPDFCQLFSSSKFALYIIISMLFSQLQLVMNPVHQHVQGQALRHVENVKVDTPWMKKRDAKVSGNQCSL